MYFKKKKKPEGLSLILTIIVILRHYLSKRKDKAKIKD